jgi:hypothetical protein
MEYQWTKVKSNLSKSLIIGLEVAKTHSLMILTGVTQPMKTLDLSEIWNINNNDCNVFSGLTLTTFKKKNPAILCKTKKMDLLQNIDNE